MPGSGEEASVAYPEVFTLHWEGPGDREPAQEMAFPGSDAEERERAARERERDEQEQARAAQGRALWERIEHEAARRGDTDLWRRKLEAYRFVKLDGLGTAGDYGRRHDVNHATVRTWIAEVAKLAYQVGYRLHEDRLLLLGGAPPGLQRLRELVNRDAASSAAWDALQEVEAEYRGEDPWFHLNEGHVFRARRLLRDSDDTLKEGLAIAEAPRVRSLLWNARGQTLWDCRPDSDHPLPDHLARAEKAFRRAAILDASTYFPFVNLAQLAVDAGDARRAAYWITELGAARKGMEDTMKDDLARYLHQAEWTGAVEERRFWRNGPGRWLAQAAKRGIVPLLVLALGIATAVAPTAVAEPMPDRDLVVVSNKGAKARSGAGGN